MHIYREKSINYDAIIGQGGLRRCMGIIEKNTNRNSRTAHIQQQTMMTGNCINEADPRWKIFLLILMLSEVQNSSMDLFCGPHQMDSTV